MPLDELNKYLKMYFKTTETHADKDPTVEIFDVIECPKSKDKKYADISEHNMCPDLKGKDVFLLSSFTSKAMKSFDFVVEKSSCTSDCPSDFESVLDNLLVATIAHENRINL